jgi:hypothetical protein
MVETVRAPKTCVSTIAGDITVIDFTDDTASEAQGPSITGS